MRFLLNEGIIVLKNQLDMNDAEIETAAPILRSIMLSNIWMPNIEHLESVPDSNMLDAEWLLERTIEVGEILTVILIG